MKNKKPAHLTSGNAPATCGFTLMETVIAIGVLAILLTGFIAVFTPAAQGIRRSISAQQADRLSTTLENEMVILRDGQQSTSITTGFEKAYDWIEKADDPSEAIFVYQYRGDATSLRQDGTPQPMSTLRGQPGENYTIQSMARRASDPEFANDLQAIEGAIFFVRPNQLVFNGSQMVPGTLGEIVDPQTGDASISAAAYEDAVIAFSAEFHSVPSKSALYINGSGFTTRYSDAKRPVFTRNLAVRR